MFLRSTFFKGMTAKKNWQFGLWGTNNLSQIIIILGKGITGEYNQQKCSSSLAGRHPRPREFNSFKATHLLQCLRLPFRKYLARKSVTISDMGHSL